MRANTTSRHIVIRHSDSDKNAIGLRLAICAILQQYSARSARRHKAWGDSPRIPIEVMAQAREAGDSRIIIELLRDLRIALSLAPRAKNECFLIYPWGLRPRLYAYACSAGYLANGD